MSREQVEACVDAIFEDLRDRRFLKWLFAEDPANMGPILHERDGTPLLPLDEEVQNEIREAWVKIIMDLAKSDSQSGG